MKVDTQVVHQVTRITVRCNNVDDNGSDCMRQMAVYVASGSFDSMRSALNNVGWDEIGEYLHYCPEHGS